MVGVTPVPTEVVQVTRETTTPVHMSEPKTGEAYHGGRAVVQGGAHRVGGRYSGSLVALWRWLMSALSANRLRLGVWLSGQSRYRRESRCLLARTRFLKTLSAFPAMTWSR